MTFSKIGLVLTLFILLKIAVRHGIRGLEVSKKVDKSILALIFDWEPKWEI